jgi:hypothetical protein
MRLAAGTKNDWNNAVERAARMGVDTRGAPTGSNLGVVLQQDINRGIQLSNNGRRQFYNNIRRAVNPIVENRGAGFFVVLPM